MSPVISIGRCAVLLFAVCLYDSFSKADASELQRDPKITEIEDRDVVWGEKGNFKNVNKLDEVKTNQYGMEQDGR